MRSSPPSAARRPGRSLASPIALVAVLAAGPANGRSPEACEPDPGTTGHGNLQTFLVIPEHGVPGGARASTTGMPSKARMDVLIRKADEIKRRRR